MELVGVRVGFLGCSKLVDGLGSNFKVLLKNDKRVRCLCITLSTGWLSIAYARAKLFFAFFSILLGSSGRGVSSNLGSLGRFLLTLLLASLQLTTITRVNGIVVLTDMSQPSFKQIKYTYDLEIISPVRGSL
jgi:hypothetical protein